MQVIETPGHTKGSVSFYEKKNKLLFSGDCLFKGNIGRYDLESGSKEEMKESLEKLLKLDSKVLLPGHGEILRENYEDNIKEVKTLI